MTKERVRVCVARGVQGVCLLRGELSYLMMLLVVTVVCSAHGAHK
jgi:hypothetical protein